MQAHSAPLGMMFSTNTSLAFPARWKEGFFVAFHGSFNRSVATGYKVVYIPAFAPGGGGNPPTINFATAGTSWRPVDMIIGADNALYISADTGNTIYRVTYTGQ
jgi:glucose/arabinose dehydrogenase